MTDDTERSDHDLRGLVVRGVGWMMASQGVTQVLALVTSVVIARFLGPREVGLAVEALVFGSLALVIVDFGLASAIVQRRTLSEEDKSTVFWAGLALGVVMTLVGIGLSWPIASLYGESEVQPLFAVLSLGFLFVAPGIVQGALLTRELEFRSLELRTVIATTVSSVAGITLAVLGFGPWAIIAQHLVITSFSTALLWRASPWRPTRTFSVSSLRSMARYASHIFGTATLNWSVINLDNFLVGRFLGPAPLGAYSIAYSVVVTPMKRIASPVTQVFFPAFSRMRDPRRIAETWLRAVRMVALVVVPLMAGLVAVAPDFVEVVFGPRWREAIPVTQILAPAGLLLALAVLNQGILESLARTRTLFRFTLVLSIVTVGAFAAGLPWGIHGVATAYLIVTVVMQPLYVWLTTRAVGLAPWDWLRSVAGVLQAGIVMLVIALAARELLMQTDLSVTLRLVVVIVLGGLAYVPLVVWRAPEVRNEVRAVLDRRRRAPDALASESTEPAV